ncbi:MAG: sulfotransferase [Aliiglaciecola sp.]|uniref:sulfotransferase n=1 Tax=Aliiglaciecola sp. TaxID=1872441 RepID=UPI003299C416
MVPKHSNKLIQPIIILSAPRAGSTLLFETLAKHPELWTVGGESHHIIEHIPALSTVARGYVSNRLDQSDADESTVATLRNRFYQGALKAKGLVHTDTNPQIRLLEKTPKNALRIPFLLSVFPDAKFIYLVRDPRENISSIMDGWRSGRFVTYPEITAADSRWSFLLPDGWQDYKSASRAAVARFQWQSANDAILNALGSLPASQYEVVCYQDLVAQPMGVINRLTDFAHLSAFTENLQHLPLSRYTLSPPNKNKWKQNEREVCEQLPYVENTLAKINALLGSRGIRPLDVIDLDFDRPVVQTPIDATNKNHSSPKVSRNAPCPCGSGKRYKQCHGLIVK